MKAVMVIKDSTIIVGEKSVSWDHPNCNLILEALRVAQDPTSPEDIREDAFERIDELMVPIKAIEKAGEGKWTIENGEVILDGEPVDGLLYKRIMDLHGMGLSVDNLIAFERRARQNPSYRVRRDLYAFLEYGKLPIDEDGRFIARKVVREDFFDFHSGTVNWAPGNVVEMPREKVDDDPNRTCSAGLHVYNAEYGKSFGGSYKKVLAVAVDPADVVSIPVDYNNTKMRVCKAEVLKELTHDEDPSVFSSLNYGEPLDPDDDYETGTGDDDDDRPTIDDVRDAFDKLKDLLERYDA